MAKVTLQTLAAMKESGEKFACLTAYDSTFANIVSTEGVEVILIGDSLGNVIQGENTHSPRDRRRYLLSHTLCCQRL